MLTISMSDTTNYAQEPFIQAAMKMTVPLISTTSLALLNTHRAEKSTHTIH